MIQKLLDSTDPDIVGWFTALRRPAKGALQMGLETNTRIHVTGKGRIVDVTKEYQGKRKRSRCA